MADNTIDTLNIQIESSTTQAVRSINNLVKKLDTLNTAFGNLDISRLNNFSNSLKSLGSVNFKANGLNAAINAINRLGKSDFSQFDTGKLGKILTEMQKLDAIPDVSPSVSRFTTAIAKLAGTGQYIGNVSKELPNLATGLNNVAAKLSSMSEVSASTNAFITSLGKYVWDETDDTIFFHMFVGQKAELEKADIDVESSYPWEGKVTYHVHSKKEEEYTLAIHIPGYLKDICVKVNGEQIEWKKFMKNGYLYLTRKWGESQVEILFDLEVRKVYANKNVREDAGKVALMRGPFVYCFEGVDNGNDLQAMCIDADTQAETFVGKEGVLKDKVCIHVQGYEDERESDALYSEEKPDYQPHELTAIPYYLWGNRGVNQMRVWMLEK